MTTRKAPFKATPHWYSKYAWVIWGLSILFVFYKYIIEMSPSIMTNDLMKAFDIDAKRLGNFAGIFYYSYMIMQIPVGLFLDTHGPRKMTTIGLLVCSLGILIFGLSSTIYIANIGRFLTGLGASFSFVSALKLSANWFPAKKFAMLTGLTMTLGTLGAVFGQAPLAFFIRKLGWRQSIIDLAIIGFVLTFVYYLLVKDRPKHLTLEAKFKKVEQKIRLSKAIHYAIKQPYTWVLSIYSGLAFALLSAFGGLWGVTFLQTKYHLTHDIASLSTSLFFIGFAVGAPLFGWYSNFIGRRKPIMIYGMLLALIFLCIPLYSLALPTIVIGISLFLSGLFLSTFLLSFSLIHEINIPMMTATAVGIMNTLNAFFGAVTDPLIGFFLDLFWDQRVENGVRIFSSQNYTLSLTILPFYLIICLGLLFFIKETFCKQTFQTGETT